MIIMSLQAERQALRRNFVTDLLDWHLSTTWFVTGFLVSGRTSSMSGNIVKHPKARQLLTKLGRNSLVPTKSKNGKWHKPKLSRRVAKVLRKESLRQGQYSIGTNDGWDPLWDKRRSNTVQVPHVATCTIIKLQKGSKR